MHHYHALLLMRDSPGLTPGKIAKELSIKPSAVTRLMNHFAKAGLMEREFGDDRRTVPSYLTEKGIALVKEIDGQILSP